MSEIVKKINKEMFELILSGKKKFDARIENDCKFKEGDTLVLKEYNEFGKPSGRQLTKKISFILRTKECKFWSKKDIDTYGFAILSLE